MASKDPFYFAKSHSIASIRCVGCGSNMYCFRRSLAGQGERQWFICAGCGNESERTVGLRSTDATIQTDESEKTLDAGQRPA
jgi:hypothetical protein